MIMSGVHFYCLLFRCKSIARFGVWDSMGVTLHDLAIFHLCLLKDAIVSSRLLVLSQITFQPQNHPTPSLYN